MRRANDSELITDADDKVIGINLGYDFCSEHERGIKDILDALGVSIGEVAEENFGIKGRTTTRFDENSFFFEQNETHTCLTFEPRSGQDPQGWDNGELGSTPNEITSAWDGCSFGIVMANEYSGFLSELYEAFKRHDVAVGLSGDDNSFANAGFALIIASNFSTEDEERLREQDESHHKLQKAVEATGIRDKLEVAGKRYHALSPRWVDEGETEISYWLNPEEQRNNNYGWFTLQDLLDWIQNKGPILKVPEGSK